MAWSEDKCTGGTAGASSEYYAAANAFDNNAENLWSCTNGAVPCYIGYDFGAGNAQQIEKVRAVIGNAAALGYGPDDFEIRGSNTGFEAGDKVTLDTIENAGAWSEDTWREWEFTNATAYRYIWLYVTNNYSGANNYVMLSEIEMLVNEVVAGEISDDAGMGDSVEIASFSDEITDNAGMGDSAELMSLSDEITDGAGMGDSAAAVRAQVDNIFGTVLLADSVEIIKTVVGPVTENAGMGDSVEFFNYSAWLRSNLDLAVTRYFFTLTGSADGKSDIEIPIISFQARKRQGEPTYLAVTIRGEENYDYITDRPNGEMVLEMAYQVGGSVNFRQEIIRVDLDDIRTDQGGRNFSITLTGYRTETWANKIATLQNPIYISLSGGTHTIRFALPDPFLNPGDTLKIGGSQYLVDYIVYTVAENYQMMEVYEAE